MVIITDLENLYPVIAPVRNYNISLWCYSHSLWSLKLSPIIPLGSKPSQERPVFVKDLNPMIERVTYNDAIVSVCSDSSRPVKFSIGSSALSELEQKLTSRAEHLNPIVAEVRNYHVTFAVDRNPCWAVELTIAITKATEWQYYLAFLIENYHARVPTIHNEQTSLAVHCQTIWLIKAFTLNGSLAKFLDEFAFFCEYLQKM